jgi:hypothetical protein
LGAGLLDLAEMQLVQMIDREGDLKGVLQRDN